MFQGEYFIQGACSWEHISGSMFQGATIKMMETKMNKFVFICN
jgi:hypothetical protein